MVVSAHEERSSSAAHQSSLTQQQQGLETTSRVSTEYPPESQGSQSIFPVMDALLTFEIRIWDGVRDVAGDISRGVWSLEDTMPTERKGSSPSSLGRGDKREQW